MAAGGALLSGNIRNYLIISPNLNTFQQFQGGNVHFDAGMQCSNHIPVEDGHREKGDQQEDNGHVNLKKKNNWEWNNFGGIKKDCLIGKMDDWFEFGGAIQSIHIVSPFFIHEKHEDIGEH